MKHYLEIKGDNYEIGYAVGKYWGKYLKRCQKKYSRYDDKNKRELIELYIKLLSCSWKKDFTPLMINTSKYFPDIMSEVAGMEKGVAESGFITSFVNIFGLCLGETGDPSCHCSSIVAKTNNGYLMGTNDEDYTVDPLLLSKVHLKKDRGHKKFVSISHPFQLLGSAAGMNKHIAFQGNSIGFSEKVYYKIKDTWHCRVPKTILTRRMLDMDSIDEIKHLLKSYHCTLPNHHYIISHNKAFSVDVVPKVDNINCSKGSLVKIIKIKDRHFHTNHFLKGNRSQQKDYLNDDSWEWSNKKDLKDSKARFKKLSDRLQMKSLMSVDDIRIILLGMAKEYKKFTSASLLFKMSDRESFCESLFYFNKKKSVSLCIKKSSKV